MAEANCLLPPSPNWYCSSAAECNKSGIYTFAAKSHVFLLDVNCEPPVFRGQFTEHSERVNAVACSPDCKLCSSAGEDKSVRIWDMESRTIIASHNAHQNKVTCLCWSSVSSDLVLSADEKGTIIAWKHEKNVVYSFCPIQEYVFCISASCQSEQVAAVGYKNGLIIVVQLQEQGLRLVHRLRGHDSDIHSLSWCPVSIDHLQLGHLQEKVMNSQGNLLISGSRDQTLRLWDTLNGKVLSILNLPKRASQKWKDRHDWQSKDRVWLALCWPRSLPNKMISSSHSGELLLWDLSVPSGSDQFQYFSHGHSRIVFNISCNNDGTKAVSFSMDRQIIIWDLKTLHSLHCISTLGGYVYGLDISPLDPGAVAVGVGDNMIRIWNTNSSLSTFDAVTLWQGIKSKVQVVSWHPSKEGILAFGTDVGQVGIYNTVSKKPKVFASYHKNTVYSLSWGPPCPENKDKNDDSLHLYSCSGDGSVLEHRPSQPLQDAFNVNKLIETTNGVKHKLMSCSEVSWNCDRAFLAIGNSDGTIELFRAPSLRRVCTISVHKKSITNLAWHPGYGEDNSEDEGRLPYRLASGSNETTIHVHDLSRVLNTEDVEKSVSTITSSYRKLVGHSGRVTSLCWSPHHRDMLVSASYDGTAQIWNVESNQTISNFRGHVGRLLSVQWSFLDADVVYSGGEDGSVRAWRISEQKYSQPPASGSKTSKNKKKSKSKTTESHETKTQTNSEILPEQQATELQKPGCNDALYVASSSTEIGEKVESWRRPVTTSPVGSGDPFTPARKIDGSVAVVSVDDEDAASVGSFSAQGSGPTIIVSKSKAGESSKKKRKVKSMFPLSAVADNNTRCAMQQDCIALAQYLATKQSGAARSQDAVLPGESSNVNLGFFADRTSAYKMFEAEGRHHSSANNLDYQLQLEVWKGNLGGAIEKAIKAKQLNDWLVAMSAQGGHGVWLHTVECFANQLLSEGSYHRAVLYFLACHKVYDAIDVFKNQLMFREAIALAKVRLSPSDPVLHDLYCMWAKKLEGEHYENAAKCYLAAGLPGEAVRVLSIRGDQASLTTALKVSMVSSDLQQLSSSIAVRVMHICMETGNWYAAEEALAMCQGVEGHLSALYTHEVLVNELLQQGLIMDTEFKEQEHSKNFSSSSVGKHESIIDNFQELPPQESLWLVNTQPRDWFIGRILKAWDRTGTLTLQGTNLVSSIKQLSSYLQSNLNENLSIKQVLTRISYDISLGLLSGIHQDNYACALPWLQALESCIKNNYFVLAQFLCVQLLPRGTQSFEDISLLRIETNESIGSNREFLLERKPVSNDKLLSYFNGFYCLIVLYKMWFRAPEILQRFSNSSEVEIESHLSTTDSNGFSRECSEGLNASFNVAERIIAEINCNSNASLNETPVNAQNSNLCDEDGTLVKDPLPSSLQSLETSTAPNEGDLDICHVLSTVHDSLLTENIFICSTLKKQLLEVKKEVILLRSRRILDSVAASGSSKQKKATKKKNREQQPSEESGEILVSSTAVEKRNIVDKEEQDDSRQEGIQSDVLQSLDVRYKSADWTLELMQEEEQRILEELSKHPLKDLPFPDPTESAIVLGHVCSKAASYPCHEPAVLYNLGLKAVNSGLEHAQWTTQRNALDQIKKCLHSRTLTDK